MKLSFAKMSGAGNDFIFLDGRECGNMNLRELSTLLCRRKVSVGADGLAAVSPLGGNTLEMNFFNPDGTSAFCGNALRCCAVWAFRRMGGEKRFRVHTVKGLLEVEMKSGNAVEAQMPSPAPFSLDFAEISGMKIHFADTGVPHAVAELPGLERADIVVPGKRIRFDRIFGKDGTNADFIGMKGGILFVRTYERGVENETLACGTGITASAIIASALGLAKPPVKCVSFSGEKFEVDFRLSGGEARDIRLTGPAREVFTAEIEV